MENNKIRIESISEIDPNSNTSFVMPNINTINQVIFSTHFLAFTKQSVKGSIIAVYKVYSDNCKQNSYVISLYREGNIIFENNAKYLNNCFHSFFNNTDDYIKNKINLMIKHGHFKHAICLFNFIWSFSQNILYYVLGRIDLAELIDEAYLSKSIDNILDALLPNYVDYIMENNNLCNNECKNYVYNKRDFIQIIKKGHNKEC